MSLAHHSPESAPAATGAQIINLAAARASRQPVSLADRATARLDHEDRRAVRVGNVPVHRFDRIRLNTQGATKAWRALAADLAAAYDALTTEGEAGLPAWERAAVAALASEDATTEDFAALVSLASILIGHRASIHIHTDDWSRSGNQPITQPEAVLAMLHTRAVFPRQRGGKQ